MVAMVMGISYWETFLLYSYAGFSYEVLRMYDVEKCSAVPENVAGFARLDAYIRSHNKIATLGYVYIGETNFSLPQTLYESECHQR